MYWLAQEGHISGLVESRMVHDAFSFPSEGTVFSPALLPYYASINNALTAAASINELMLCVGQLHIHMHHLI